MIFSGTALKDAWLVDIEKREDERGFFARAWDRREFEARGLNPDLAQCNISFNSREGTLRGMHFQARPHEETKLVRCTRGSLFDAIIDLRPGSPTYKKQLGVVLTADNRRMLYVPEGFAHGFLTLEDATEVFYQISELYAPESQRGVRWNDPAFAIAWPAEPKIISERDRSYPDFGRVEAGGR
jgi:dTDP-4-dehydrorhamnose 3,5-epimerase